MEWPLCKPSEEKRFLSDFQKSAMDGRERALLTDRFCLLLLLLSLFFLTAIDSPLPPPPPPSRARGQGEQGGGRGGEGGGVSLGVSRVLWLVCLTVKMHSRGVAMNETSFQYSTIFSKAAGP